MIEHEEVFRIRTEHVPGTLAAVLGAIARFDALIGDVVTVHFGHDHNIRDVNVITQGDAHLAEIERAIADVPHVTLMAGRADPVLAAHEGGKLVTRPREEVRTLRDMRHVYTPGVARVSRAIADAPELADRYTWRGRTVAVISDGSRVLGLGDVGPRAALPVMEGKAVFYSQLVDLNAVPIVLDVHDPVQIVETVTAISPGFGAIHLEDIASPGVFEIEAQLDAKLSVPVMHDDQHGTAVVVLAAVLSATAQLNTPLEDITFGQVGLGAAGSAIARLALEFPFGGVVAFDPTQAARERFVQTRAGTTLLAMVDKLSDLLGEADVVVLTTGRPDLLAPEDVRRGSVIFALSNPRPEIDTRDALRAGAKIAADGSVVNNVLAYPGIFRGALDAGASSISGPMKQAAAAVLADLAPPDRLLPEPLDRSVHLQVAAAVGQAAQ